MNDALALLEQVNVPLRAAEDFAAEATDYLSRVQLMSSASEKVKANEFTQNNFAFVSGDNFDDIGKEVDVWFINVHAKALDTKSDPIIACHNRDAKTFTDIMMRSEEQDSGCMYGPEFLIYVPAKKQFATLFFSSKSARRESQGAISRLKQAGTLTAKFIKGKKFSWSVLTVKDCNTPMELPSAEALTRALKMFADMELDKATPEKAPEQKAAAPARAR